MSFLIIFDIGKGKASLRVKVNRKLNSLHAKMVQDSVWEHSNLSELKSIANLIKRSGGDAIIIKKDIVYS